MALVERLADELRNHPEFGQPVITEEVFPRTQLIRAVVLWDEWARIREEDRVAVVLDAYEQAEGKDYRDRIALAIALTFPEAYEMGMLPFEVTGALRRDDRVTEAQCHKAMVALGASMLEDPKRPQLRFATLDEAEAAVKRLTEALPGSEPVWLIQKEVRRDGNLRLSQHLDSRR